MVQPESVVVHPLVLLSVVDHYNRAARVRRTLFGSIGMEWTCSSHIFFLFLLSFFFFFLFRFSFSFFFSISFMQNTKKRVVGVLLGSGKGKDIDVANSFAGNYFLDQGLFFFLRKE